MKSLKHLNKYLWKYRLRLSMGILFVIASNYFAIAPIEYIRKILDITAQKIALMDNTTLAEEKSAQFDDFFSTILYYIFLLFFMTFLRGIFLYFNRQTIIVMSRLIEFDLKQEIYTHYQKLSTSFYKRNHTGDLMNRVSEDVGHVRMYLGPGIMYSINIISTTVIVVYIMLKVNPTLTFYCLLPLPFLSITIYYVSKRINKQATKIQRSLSKLFNISQETFSGIRTIKAFNVEKYFIDNFENKNNDYKKKSIRLTLIQSLFFPSMIFFTTSSVILILLMGGGMVINNQDVSLGNIAEFIIYLNILTWPVISLGWITSVIQRAEVSQGRINDFLNTPIEIESKGDSKKEIMGESCCFENVYFKYPYTERYVLENISFRIQKGHSIAILGTTGSGKSTIAQLLLRMYDCTKGKILYDGMDNKDINIEKMREKIGYVSQDVFLFSDTIRANIVFGIDEIEEEKVIQAAKDACIYQEIQNFSKGFDTVVGEKGIMLSGGQKQRISIARTLLKNPKILVLDDCFSALDTKTENALLKILQKKMKDRITIIISHRISSVKLSNEIILLDKNHIVAKGTHQELLKNNSIYKQLYEKQIQKQE